MNQQISINKILMFTGYFLIGVAVFLAITLWLCRNNNGKKKKNKEAKNDESGMEKGKSIINSAPLSESGTQSMVVLTMSPEANWLKFEELLKAPAELLGRGKHGSLYKVMCENPRTTLTVKRIKDWEISGPDFKKRMEKLRELKHRNVLSVLAFYSSSLEKLLVYEYQQNGSLLRRFQTGKAFDWSSRLSVAASITDALAFMHHHLKEDGKILPHGNLKSSNIMFNHNMEACISEYGLVGSAEEEEEFKADMYGLGVILLELLTGKKVENNNGQELANWVVAVLREEWTVEVFDRALIQEGASEGRIVALLQIAVKCVNRSPEARPTIHQVATMISSIKEEEDRSMDASQSITIT